MLQRVAIIGMYFFAFYVISSYFQICPCQGPVRTWAEKNIDPIFGTLHAVKDQEVNLNQMSPDLQRKFKERGREINEGGDGLLNQLQKKRKD